MPHPGKDTKRHRRVSFAESEPPSEPPTATNTHANRHPSPHPSPHPSLDPSSTPNLKPAIKTSGHHSRVPPPAPSPPGTTAPPPPRPATPDGLAGLFCHTVTNTPQGLVIDGVLQPRGAALHSNPSFPQPQPFPGHPGYPTYSNGAAQPPQVNMSTVGAGITPDPNAAHYQPPVPDTTYGPYQYTYVPRSDPQFMMMNGMPPGCYAPGAMPYPQVHPGMATAPIPMMASGCQPPFMQPPQMPPCAPGFQPACMPPMAFGAPATGPAYVATGIGHPTPPITPPGGMPFPGANMGGFEMGKTKNEINAENQYNSVGNQMNEPQSMKPADDDTSRMYWCRELDGAWIARSRFSLDRMGNFRWYVTENGVFYAKMLPE
ncbi:hypothetical protein F5Y08DRAFT_338952 [Xylaria arbuscula]|nr:hypothetical protein F5Y08DRAFT_338952 [Xylaria arbuscula]